MAAKRPKSADSALPADFEATMRELRSIVEQFERGVKLQQHAQKQLEAARLRIEELLPEGGLTEIEADDDEEEE
jgi:exonuclease VII small subunit